MRADPTPDAPAIEALAENLAANLREQRSRRAVSQAALAARAEIPRSTLANIESGAANPTLAVLASLARALSLPIEELLSAPPAELLLHPVAELTLRVQSSTGARVRSLLPRNVPAMTFERVELPEGGHLTGVPHRAGTREYLCCEQGIIRLTVQGEEVLLRPGDVAEFPGDRRHGYHHEKGRPAVGFSVVALLPPGR